eukprot:COSAG01_NODE_33662_length_560_cov_9.772234_1_plen_85_part_10
MNSQPPHNHAVVSRRFHVECTCGMPRGERAHTTHHQTRRLLADGELVRLVRLLHLLAHGAQPLRERLHLPLQRRLSCVRQPPPAT